MFTTKINASDITIYTKSKPPKLYVTEGVLSLKKNKNKSTMALATKATENHFGVNFKLADEEISKLLEH